MFKIQWKNHKGIFTGLSSYPTVAAANRQMKIWQNVFPHIQYFLDGCEFSI